MNAENRKQVIAVVALGIILVGVLGFQFLRSGNSGTTAATGTAVVPSPAAAKPASPPSLAGAPGLSSPLESLGSDINALLDELLKEVQVVSFDYQAQGEDRNPMTPLVGLIQTRVPQPGESLTPTPFPLLQKKVSAILWNENNPLAVVDNNVVGPGHTYPDGIQVHAIARDRVIFKINDALIPIELKEQ
jgi:hypothetical protein